jgi:hypothetical protein
MCEFVSWKELPDGSLRYLTKHDLVTKEGRALRKYLGSKFDEDIKGHGAIAHYYQLGKLGVNKEYSDFSSPKNFPAEIVNAIKNGDFEGIGIAEGILTRKANADYEAKRDALNADYKAKRAPLDADYEAKWAPLDADYKAKWASLYADYEAKRAPLDADYEAKRDALYADYEAKWDALFWRIAKDPKNRRKEWR